jgi:uncharacterized protein (DUF934 family)
MSRLTVFRADTFVPEETEERRLRLAVDADPRKVDWAAHATIELQFPKFNDGRAYSQAFLLRRRLGFKGELRAVGDVLVDEVLLMQRSGFSQAVLRADQLVAHAAQALRQFDGFYQGDAVDTAPRFAKDLVA